VSIYLDSEALPNSRTFGLLQQAAPQVNRWSAMSAAKAERMERSEIEVIVLDLSFTECKGLILCQKPNKS